MLFRSSGVPGVPLEVLQEQLRRTSGPQAGTSLNNPPFSPLDEVETVYSYAVGVPSKFAPTLVYLSGLSSSKRMFSNASVGFAITLLSSIFIV